MHSSSIQAPCVLPRLDQCDPMIAGLHRLSFEAMGCRFEVMLDPHDSGLDQWSIRAVAEEIRELVNGWHQRLSVFDPESDISRINRSPVDRPILLDPEMFALFEFCDLLHQQTDGAFNIASGTLMRAHGFRDCKPFAGSGIAFDLETAADLSPANRTITRTHELTSFDFGAVAKGYVLDLIRDLLVEYGIKNAFVHGGTSSILARGVDKAGSPWPVMVGDGVTVDASGFAMGISEGSSREIERNGERIGHVMDTRTNTPAQDTIKRLVCVHHSAAVADAYSTACLARPTLIKQLCSNAGDHPCAIIAVDSETNSPLIIDPLGVVIKRSEVL